MASSAIHMDTTEVRLLIHDLDRIPGLLPYQIAKAMRRDARDIERLWKAHSRAHDLPHGKHYPKAITHELVDGGLGAVIGPESARPQGGMGKGFEYGSRNQKPHLSGNYAADVVEPRIADHVGEAGFKAMDEAL